MIRLQLIEHGRLHCWRGHGDPPDPSARDAYAPRKAYEALQAIDLRRAEGPALSWSLDHASAAQWVGVIHAPGLVLEILPKIDGVTSEDGPARVRRNLLYMLGVAGMVPVRQVDLARLAHRRAPLSEVLVRIFAHRLQSELQRGIDRRYVQREDDLRAFKGKLLVGEQVRRFAAHRERFRCRFDEFSWDTPMNQVFRHVAHELALTTRDTATAQALRRCLLLLDDVAVVQATVADVDAIALDRKSERFADLLAFCRLVLAGRSPTAKRGGVTTYSLLFDMNEVFERFVANFVRRRVLPGLLDVQLFAQARRRRRALMRSRNGGGLLYLKPDLLFDVAGTPLVVDTKWKVVGDGARTRPSAADLYQLFAYTKRYAAPRSVLLYPHHGGFVAEVLDVLGSEGRSDGQCVELRSVDLAVDLWSEAGRAALAAQLRDIVAPLSHASSPATLPTQ